MTTVRLSLLDQLFYLTRDLDAETHEMRPVTAEERDTRDDRFALAAEIRRRVSKIGNRTVEPRITPAPAFVPTPVLPFPVPNVVSFSKRPSLRLAPTRPVLPNGAA